MKRGISIVLIFLIISITLNSSLVFSQANDPSRTKKILDECSITARSDSENIKVTLRTTQNGDVFVYLYNENVIPEIGNLKLIDITQTSENNIYKFNYQNKEYITDSIDLEKEINNKKICYIDEPDTDKAGTKKTSIGGRESVTVTINCGSYATQSQCKSPCEWKPTELPSICSNPLINPPSFGNPTMEFFIGLPLKIISFILRPIISFFSNIITGKSLPDCRIDPRSQCRNPSGVNAIIPSCNQFPIGQTSYSIDSTDYNNGRIQSNGDEISNPKTRCNEIPNGIYDETDNGISPEQYEIPGQVIFASAQPPLVDYCEIDTNYLHEFTSCNNYKGYKELIIDCSKLSINNIPMVCQGSACIGQQTTTQPSTRPSYPLVPMPAQVPNQNTCYEVIVDSGLNYENYGEVSYTFQGHDVNDKDRCINEKELEEYACCQGNNENGDVKVEFDCITLGEGYKCKEGRCMKEGEQTAPTRSITGPTTQPCKNDDLIELPLDMFLNKEDCKIYFDQTCSSESNKDEAIGIWIKFMKDNPGLIIQLAAQRNNPIDIPNQGKFVLLNTQCVMVDIVNVDSLQHDRNLADGIYLRNFITCCGNIQEQPPQTPGTSLPNGFDLNEFKAKCNREFKEDFFQTQLNSALSCLLTDAAKNWLIQKYSNTAWFNRNFPNGKTDITSTNLLSHRFGIQLTYENANEYRDYINSLK